MDTGAILSSYPHIPETIFKNLGARDLCNVASVCKLWSIISAEELKRRRRVTWFFQELKCRRNQDAHFEHEDCSLENASELEQGLREQFQNLQMKPAFCIAFATSGFLEHFENLFFSHGVTLPRKKLKINRHKYLSREYRNKLKRMEDESSRHKDLDSVIEMALRNNLPSTCKVSCFIGSNIVASKQDCSPVLRREVPAITGYLFPDLPDGELELCKRKVDNYDLRTIIKSEENIKCILALIEHKHMFYFTIALSERRHKVDAVRGWPLAIQRGNNYIPVFRGPKVVVACHSNQENECNFEQLKRDGFKNNTIAFVFAQELRPSIVEELHDLYPHIPFVGLFGKHIVEGDDESEINEAGARSYLCDCLSQGRLRFYPKWIFLSFKDLQVF